MPRCCSNATCSVWEVGGLMKGRFRIATIASYKKVTRRFEGTLCAHRLGLGGFC